MSDSPLASDVNPFARLKFHVETAVELYAKSSEKEPFWFLYHRPRTPSKLLEDTFIVPSFAEVLGLGNDDLGKLVNHCNRRSFSVLENTLDIVTRKVGKDTFFMLGNRSKGMTLAAPSEQLCQDSIPLWVRRIPKMVPTGSGEERISNNPGTSDMNLKAKRSRGNDKLVGHKCGDCGTFNLPSRYEPILTTRKDEMTEQLASTTATIQELHATTKNKSDHEKRINTEELFQKDAEIAAMQSELMKKEEEVDRLRGRLRVVTDALLKEKEDNSVMVAEALENQRLVKIGAQLSHLLQSDRWPGTALGYRLYGMAWAQAPGLSADSFNQLIPLVIAGFLGDAELGDLIDLKTVPNATPSSSVLKKVGRVGRHIILNEIARMLDADPKLKPNLAHDKGERGGCFSTYP